MAKITDRKKSDDKEVVTVKTKPNKFKDRPGDWWNASSKREMTEKLLGTATFLKEQNQQRYRQASIYARLYGNMPLYGFLGTNMSRIVTKAALPADRPTMSVITSCIDTITSRLTQNKPRPVFLTDNGDYRQRSLAKQLNQFIAGELYQTKAYRKGALALRDACVWGTGVIKVLRDQQDRVALERRLATQLLVDPNEAFLGDPRQLIELQLMDRQVLMAAFPDYRSLIEKAEQAYPDSSEDSNKTVSDQVMVVEAWRLPSSPKQGDGMHVIACNGCQLPITEKEWKKMKFPFAMTNYSDPQVGHWGQGLAERQMGTQMGINQLLMTIHTAINLVGVPRVFVEDGSKVVKAHLNNSIGSIVTYRGTKPSYEVAPCVPVELYQQLERLIKYAYNQEGVSELAAVGQKPAGLNSGAAQREYDDIQSDRFASLQKRYEDLYIDLSYLMMDEAIEIAKETGKYQTIYPNKDGTKEINLPDFKKLTDDPFVIQCYDVSSLPKEPAGRLQKITEMMQSGLISSQEGRRLLNFPDTEQEDKLATAAEEKILKQLDDIVEHGKYTPPEPNTDLALAAVKVVQYYNLYTAVKLEEKKAQMLRDYQSQVRTLQSQAAAAMAPQAGLAPQAVPQAAPVSELIPNVPGAMPAA